ncbi:hypothetical protein V9T40_000860 [Parthenolecanium corni]|uniref:Extracellular superoxide dismutase [Cu-Zn] n=1 Tax=Parthenolecanium corni TaxID=536013 RepID=A0AAN9TR76_9HEMI
MSTNVEFAIQMHDKVTANVLKNSLSELSGVDNVSIYPESGTLVIKSSLPISVLQEKIEETGQRAVIKGFGDSVQAAVAIVGGECGFAQGKLQGVVRFIQADDNTCIVDGTIDGLSPGLHGLHVHEFGDISEGCDKVGQHFSLVNASHGAPSCDTSHRHTGDLGNIQVNEDGRSQFRFSDSVLKVWDVIGRTIVVTENADDLGKGNNPQSLIDGNSGKRLGCGIIARSAGLFENTKKICACDGVSLWDERNKPLAGPGRQTHL